MEKENNILLVPVISILNITAQLNNLVASEIILLFKGSYLQTACSKGTQIVWDKIYKQCDSKACNIQYDCF